MWDLIRGEICSSLQKNPTSKNRDCSDIKSGRSCLHWNNYPFKSMQKHYKLYQWKRMQRFTRPFLMSPPIGKRTWITSLMRTDLLPPLASQCQEWQKAITPAWAKCFTALETFSFRRFPFLTCGAYSCTSRVPAALKICFLKYFNPFLNYPTE